VTAVAVLFFGGLTFIFQDELFIKMKPTIVNTIFGSVLLIALAMGKPLLPVVLDSVMRLTETGWKILTLRWGLFFFLLAGLNEVVWRTQTTDFWVSFKVFGTILSCKVAVDATGASKSYGFVHFDEGSSAQEALTNINGMEFGGRVVEVMPYLPRQNRSISR
jgi:intracellular septation protein A